MANLVSSTLTGNLTVTANVSAANYTGNGAALTGIASFASGTKMVFYQASAPTGWTKDTASALANAAMSIVTGTGGGTGGTDSFYSTFKTSKTTNTKNLPVTGSVTGTVGATTLSTPTIASHVHTGCFHKACNDPGTRSCTIAYCTTRNQDIINAQMGRYNAGGGGSHSHPFSGSLGTSCAPNASFSVPAMNIKYANVIIASKD
jgi:hypothetical protein